MRGSLQLVKPKVIWQSVRAPLLKAVAGHSGTLPDMNAEVEELDTSIERSVGGNLQNKRMGRMCFSNPVGIVEVGRELHKPTARWGKTSMLDEWPPLPSGSMEQGRIRNPTFGRSKLLARVAVGGPHAVTGELDSLPKNMLDRVDQVMNRQKCKAC